MKKFGIIFLSFLMAMPGVVSAGLAEDLSGKILLQVESNGEAWYVNPDDNQRYFMGRPSDAFDLMRTFGLGIASAELQGYLNTTFPSRLSGKILLDVEMNGEAYYVNPSDLKGYFLGRPADAFNVMRNQGLGITNTNLDQITTSPKSAPVPAPAPTLTPQPELPISQPDNGSMTSPANPEVVMYEIEFIATWSEETHPEFYPSSAHFSPFVAYSHTGEDDAFIFQVDEISTPGVELMAETGSTSILNDEIDTLIASDRAWERVQGGVFDSPGSSSRMLEVTENYSHVTLVSMVAPSPDWFIARSAELYQNGEWVDSLELDVFTYDSGTDSGEEFLSDNLDTMPRDVIERFGDELQDLGRVVITRIDS